MRRAFLIAWIAALLVWPGRAAERGWQISRGDVRVLCPMTVGGSFEAKTSALTGSVAIGSDRGASPLTLAGELVVDLKTLDSGIELRNDHMKRTYLEVQNPGFDKAVVSAVQLGVPRLDGFEGRTSFTGTLRLHGVTKGIAGQATIRQSAPGLQIEASFPVTLADFNIAKPQYLGVGVKPQIQVKVAFGAAPGIE